MNKQKIQEGQYLFPYHYIPQFKNGHFTQHLYWSWGFRYLGGLYLVLDLLQEINFSSLVDIGCGDGRFLKEVKFEYPDKRLLGIDISLRAIRLAKALNPDIEYSRLDICRDNSGKGKYEVATLTGVLEHIQPVHLDEFVANVARYLIPRSILILVVPHKNKPIQPKHYQHFDSEILTRVLEPFFEIEKFIFLDKKSRVFNLLTTYLLQNRFFILNNQVLLDLIFKMYRRYFLLCQEPDCERVCIVAKKK